MQVHRHSLRGISHLSFNFRFRVTKESVHTALADNFNSRGAVAAMGDLINDLNKEFKATISPSVYHVLLDATKWITLILATFGFTPSTAKDRLGWSSSRDSYYSEIK